MDDQLKIWTTVGSAGTLNQADLAKVSLHQSIIQLGVDFGPVQAVAAQDAATAVHVAPIFSPTIQAVVRYNVTPVAGLFFADKLIYGLQIRYRGRITATLTEVDLVSGTEKALIAFDSTHLPAPPGFHVELVQEKCASADLDFLNKAYYVEATLIAPELAIGNPAAISIIKLVAALVFSGH